MKMVRRAATEERTGEVREMSARKAPEKAVYGVSIAVCWGRNEGGERTSISQNTDCHHPCLLSMR